MLLVIAAQFSAALMPGGSVLSTHPAACPVAPRAASRLNAADEGFEGQVAQFAPPSALLEVRGQRAKVQEQLASAISNEDYTAAGVLRDRLAELRQKDPATVAVQLREEMSNHVASERYGEAARCRDELLVLRRFLPQYQLAGVWKGNYPNHGDELVRLHYQGDQLFATKITGDEHVPKGEVTFRADLSAPADLSEEPNSPGRSYGGGSNVSDAAPAQLPLSPLVLLSPLAVFKIKPSLFLEGFPLPWHAADASPPLLPIFRWECALRCWRSLQTADTNRGRSSSSTARDASRRAASAIRTMWLVSSS